MPRKDSVDSATMNVPSEIVAITIIGASALGITCFSSAGSETPRERAAVTKSAFLTDYYCTSGDAGDLRPAKGQG